MATMAPPYHGTLSPWYFGTMITMVPLLYAALPTPSRTQSFVEEIFDAAEGAITNGQTWRIAQIQTSRSFDSNVTGERCSL